MKINGRMDRVTFCNQSARAKAQTTMTGKPADLADDDDFSNVSPCIIRVFCVIFVFYMFSSFFCSLCVFRL